MRFDVITLFPELFGPHFASGITRRAFAPDKIDVRLWALREYGEGVHRKTDDRPFGGGPGMVMLAEPLQRALDAVWADRGERGGRSEPAEPAERCPVLHFSPTGRRLDQALVREFAAGAGAVVICGRYEGVDQRFIDAAVTHEISLGDYVLSGGELPALVLLDAVARLQEGVLNAPSHQQDSFSDGLLEAPHYSRPERWAAGPGADDARAVPPVLLSGHHAEIAAWRRQRSLELSARRRPDLIDAARAAGGLSPADEAFLRSLGLYS